jgi:hypothetical protein
MAAWLASSRATPFTPTVPGGRGRVLGAHAEPFQAQPSVSTERLLQVSLDVCEVHKAARAVASQSTP